MPLVKRVFGFVQGALSFRFSKQRRFPRLCLLPLGIRLGPLPPEGGRRAWSDDASFSALASVISRRLSASAFSLASSRASERLRSGLGETPRCRNALGSRCGLSPGNDRRRPGHRLSASAFWATAIIRSCCCNCRSCSLAISEDWISRSLVISAARTDRSRRTSASRTALSRAMRASSDSRSESDFLRAISADCAARSVSISSCCEIRACSSSCSISSRRRVASMAERRTATSASASISARSFFEVAITSASLRIPTALNALFSSSAENGVWSSEVSETDCRRRPFSARSSAISARDVPDECGTPLMAPRPWSSARPRRAAHRRACPR